MTKDEIANLAKSRAESRTPHGFKVVDNQHDDHIFRGDTWSYSVGGESRLTVFKGEKSFVSWNLSDLRSVRRL